MNVTIWLHDKHAEIKNCLLRDDYLITNYSLTSSLTAFPAHAPSIALHLLM
jgi:hypothetical protein